MSANPSRRLFGALLFAGLFALPALPAHAQAFASNPNTQVYEYNPDDANLTPAPALQRQVVAYPTNEPAGTIVIDPAHTFLYLTLGGGRALRYGVGVGREGFGWSGTETIVRKAEWPDWIPPAAMIARQPYLPRWIGGGPGNPLGARAMYLGGTDYRIHGTNDPDSIGKHMSSGCIRLLNADVIDLYSRVSVGTKVIVLPDRQSRQISSTQTDVDTPAPRAAVAPIAHTASRSGETVNGIY
jgi:lipoprotein-anchoring transpeptidase ErfK/SrfK